MKNTIHYFIFFFALFLFGCTKGPKRHAVTIVTDQTFWQTGKYPDFIKPLFEPFDNGRCLNKDSFDFDCFEPILIDNMDNTRENEFDLCEALRLTQKEHGSGNPDKINFYRTTFYEFFDEENVDKSLIIKNKDTASSYEDYLSRFMTSKRNSCVFFAYSNRKIDDSATYEGLQLFGKNTLQDLKSAIHDSLCEATGKEIILIINPPLASAPPDLKKRFSDTSAVIQPGSRDTFFINVTDNTQYVSGKDKLSLSKDTVIRAGKYILDIRISEVEKLGTVVPPIKVTSAPAPIKKGEKKGKGSRQSNHPNMFPANDNLN